MTRAHRLNVRTMARMGHKHDHIRNRDECFTYRGKVPEQLAEKFLDDEAKCKIEHFKGFTGSGKTRMCKIFARKAASGLRQKYSEEVHTFYHDLRKLKSLNGLLKSIVQALQDYLPEEDSYSSIREGSSEDMCRAFGKSADKIFMLVLDNVDRVDGNECPKILDFIQELAIETDNVYLVIASRVMVDFVRTNHMVRQHIIQPMELEDGKELLRETSGNPKKLEEHIDRIVKLVFRSPLALVTAGYQMNNKSSELAYLPDEFVAVMEDSACLTLGLENVPSEDRLCKRISEVVRENFLVLEQILTAVDCPETFETEELNRAMNHLPAGKLKQSILHIILRGSLYRVSESNDDGTSCSLESAPFVMKVLKETFCQMTVKDRFLKEFNQNLIQTVDDCTVLMTSKARELRQAEHHLLKQQTARKHDITPAEMIALRQNVIRKAIVFLRDADVDAEKIEEFETSCSKKLKEESRRYASTGANHQAVQETSLPGLTVPVVCTSQSSQTCLVQQNNPRQEKEPEACISPTYSGEIIIPGLRELNQTHEAAGNSAPCCDDPQRKPDFRVDNSNKDQKAEASKIFQEVTCEEGKKALDKTTTEPAANNVDDKLSRCGTLRVDPTDYIHSSSSQGFVSSGPSDLFIDQNRPVKDLSNNLKNSLSLSEQSVPGSLNSKDERKSIQKELMHQNSGSDVTYSALSTMQDHHPLTCPSGSENGEKQLEEGSTKQRGDSRNSAIDKSGKRAVESEFDWETANGAGGLTGEKFTGQPNLPDMKTAAENYRQNIHDGRKLPQKQENNGRQTTSSSRGGSFATRPTHRNGFVQPAHHTSRYPGPQNYSGGKGLLGPVPGSHVYPGHFQGCQNSPMQQSQFQLPPGEVAFHQNQVYYWDSRRDHTNPQRMAQQEMQQLHPNSQYHLPSDRTGHQNQEFSLGHTRYPSSMNHFGKHRVRGSHFYQGHDYQYSSHQGVPSDRFSQACGPPSSYLSSDDAHQPSFHQPRGPPPGQQGKMCPPPVHQGPANAPTVYLGQAYAHPGHLGQTYPPTVHQDQGCAPPNSLHTNGFQDFSGPGSNAYQDFRYGGGQPRQHNQQHQNGANGQQGQRHHHCRGNGQYSRQHRY